MCYDQTPSNKVENCSCIFFRPVHTVSRMTNTKFPKFRLLLSDLTHSPRAIALAVCNKASKNVCNLRLDDLPETFSFVREVDAMENTIANWGIPRNPSDGQIQALYEHALEAVQDLTVAECFPRLQSIKHPIKI